MKKQVLILISVFTVIPVFGRELKDSGKTINLARTSLALVSASSCNGDRPLSNKFYGILNAFDGGKNIVNNINYTYWSPNSTEGQWIEVEFSCPVSIDSLILEGSTQCNATLYFEKGGDKSFENIVDIIEPVRIENMISGPPPYTMNGRPIPHHVSTPFLQTTNNRTLEFDGVMNGVKRVRLTFSGHNAQLIELKIMGPAPDGKKYKVGKPRLKVTKKDSLLEAEDVYGLWLERTYGSKAVEKKVTETEESFILSYRKDNKPLLKVIVNKKDGIGKIDKGDKDVIKLTEKRPLYSYNAVIWGMGDQNHISKKGKSKKGGIAANFLKEAVSIVVEGKRPEKTEISGVITVSGPNDSKCLLPISKWKEDGKTVYGICDPRANIPFSVVSVSTEDKVIKDKILGELVSKFIPEKK